MKVDRSGDCWLWTACVTKDGYGRFYVGDGRRIILAHRFAYELLVGPIPAEHEVDHRHTCSKSCVNPAHLRPTTHKQNHENRRGAQVNSASGVRGVSRHTHGRWQAQVKHHGKVHSLGLFDTVLEAEAAVIAKRNELFTHNDRDRLGEIGDNPRRVEVIPETQPVRRAPTPAPAPAPRRAPVKTPEKEPVPA